MDTSLEWASEETFIIRGVVVSDEAWRRGRRSRVSRWWER